MPETEPSPLVKAQIVGSGRDGTEQSNILETPDEQRTLYRNAGAIEPPLDPLSLAHLFEMSGALRTNIDSYATNIDAFGYRLEPVINLDADDAREKVRLAMVQEKLVMGDEVEKALSVQGAGPDDPNPDPGALPNVTDAEVDARIDSLRREMIREKLAAERFFSFCVQDVSFEDLRVRTRQDVEATGNAYWEVLRNGAGEIVQFEHIPGHTMRLMPRERASQEVYMDTRITPITPWREPTRKRFRKFIQVYQGAMHGSKLTWFKEFGDTRIYSSASGTQYETVELLAKEEPGVAPATEVVHFKIHNTRSVYGMPRWVSEMLSVVGSRHADEVNLAYFENKSVPPMAILVSGGRLVQEDVSRLEDFVKNEIRGKRNFHKIMILQAESGDNGTPGFSTGKTKIELKPLTDATNSDAQFLQYKEKNTDSIGSVFRLPRLLRGDVRDFNRATAQTSLEFTEQQVFAPLRKSFDDFVNRCLMPVLGVNYWRFVSKGPDFSDPKTMLTAINDAASASYLTPEELRELAAKAFGTEFAKLDQDWTTRPVQLTLAGISTGQTAPNDASASKDGKPAPTAGSEEAPPEDDENNLEKSAVFLIKLAKQYATREYAEAVDGDDAL